MTNAEQNQLNHSVFYFRNRAENRRCESNTECTVCLMKNPMDQPQWLPTISSGLNKVKARLSEWHYLVCLTCCFKHHTKWRNLSLENINPISPQRNKPSSTRNLTPDAPPKQGFECCFPNISALLNILNVLCAVHGFVTFSDFVSTKSIITR